MKIIPSSKRYRYVAIVSIVLVAVALVVWMVSWLSVPSYDLTIASTAGGSVTTPGEGTFNYDEGTVVNLTAEAEEGYQFVNWTGDVDTIANVNATATTITMNDDYFITAKFAVEPKYSLIITSTEGGEVTEPGEGMFSYDEGIVVDLVAEAEESYQFVHWTGDVVNLADIDAAATTITMNGDYFITAEFVKQYDLTTSSTEGGAVTTPGEGTFNYDEGTVVDLVAEAEEGYQFVNWAGDAGTIANVEAATTTITINGDYIITANFAPYMVAAGYDHTVGLKTDGTVVAVGDNDYLQCNVGGWTDIIKVAAGHSHTVGVKSDGTVIAAGNNYFGKCNVGGWTGIVQVAAGGQHTVGLKADGTVVAVGRESAGQINVGSWTDIVQVAAGEYHTVGLKDDGTVVAVGSNADGQCDVGGWTGIVQVAAGAYHTVGLKDNGTVVAVGDGTFGRCGVGGWTGIVQVAAGGYHTAGVESDGTVVAVGRETAGQLNVGGWTGIVQVSAGEYHTVGLKSDGTVVAVGSNSNGQCSNVSGWTLIA